MRRTTWMPFHRSHPALSGRLYAGMPSQTVLPDATHYAYPAYWSANFTGCEWVEKPCLDPLPANEQCLFFVVRGALCACSQMQC